MRIPRTINQHTARLPVNSSASVTVHAEGFVSVKLHVGRTQGDGYYVGIAGLFSPEGKDWNFYVPPYFLPFGGKTAYKVVGTDENGNRSTVATGRLFVIHGCAEDDNENPIGAEGETFIHYSDGWHRMRVATDDVGRLAFTVEQKAEPEGEYSGDTGYDPKDGYDFDQPYAFNPDTGRFHPVVAFTDETGVVMARMDDPSEYGHECFSLDRNTHLWHRVDTDGSNLVVGDAP